MRWGGKGGQLPDMFEYVLRGDLQLLEHFGWIWDRNRENQVNKPKAVYYLKKKGVWDEKCSNTIHTAQS